MVDLREPHITRTRVMPPHRHANAIRSAFDDALAGQGKLTEDVFGVLHDEKDQYDGVKLPQPALAAEHVLIVDDWNWEHVRHGTLQALRDIGATIEASIEVRTTLDNTLPDYAGHLSDWHNGLFVAAIRK